MRRFPETIAYVWGRVVARYGLWAVRPAQVLLEGGADFPAGPAVWAGWHSTNMIALALRCRLQRAQPCLSFVPPGLVGASARGWVEGAGIEAVPLPKDGAGSPHAALKYVLRALARGVEVIIAVDGPFGPAHHVRPGALWLARLSGCPVVVGGFAAGPALRLPRWDRQIVPLPGARIAAVFGAPFRVDPKEGIHEPCLQVLGARIDTATRRARELVTASPPDIPLTDFGQRKK